MRLHLNRFPRRVLLRERTSGATSVMCSSTRSKVQAVAFSPRTGQIWDSLPCLPERVLYRAIPHSTKPLLTQ
jgi:hypothetical protein